MLKYFLSFVLIFLLFGCANNTNVPFLQSSNTKSPPKYFIITAIDSTTLSVKKIKAPNDSIIIKYFNGLNDFGANEKSPTELEFNYTRDYFTVQIDTSSNQFGIRKILHYGFHFCNDYLDTLLFKTPAKGIDFGNYNNINIASYEWRRSNCEPIGDSSFDVRLQTNANPSKLTFYKTDSTIFKEFVIPFYTYGLGLDSNNRVIIMLSNYGPYDDKHDELQPLVAKFIGNDWILDYND